MKLIYKIDDKPKFGQVIVFAIQQLLAILVATIAVPASVNGIAGTNLSSAAALAGAGIGTIVYLLFTKFKSPVFLGSSFSFIGSMTVAIAGAASMSLGYLGLIIGAALAALVYVIIAIVVRFAGVKWINVIMPPVVIGPTVAIIGLSLSGYAVSLMSTGNYTNAAGDVTASPYVLLICALLTIAVVTLCSVYGKKMTKLIPFVIGIAAGYILAAILTIIGIYTGNEALCVVNFAPFKALVENGIALKTFVSLPSFTFVDALNGLKEFNLSYFIVLAVAYVPVAFVVFAEHIADHKNLSSIIEKDLLKEPGLHRTLIGDGIGSLAGSIIGGCPNTTYGESVACVAITKNASVVSILGAAILAILCSFVSPFVALLESIPSCVLGGVCLTLYGFIGVSGLKMIQPLDLNDNKNLFVVSVILISGIGGLAVTFGKVEITTTACALILGILTNLMLSGKKSEAAVEEAEEKVEDKISE